MNSTERKVVAEVLVSYFEPDSPEAPAFAMYELRRIFNLAKSAEHIQHSLHEMPPLQ